MRWLGAAAVLLAGCAGGPPPPDWQANAKSSLDHALAEYLAGDSRAAAQDFDRARAEVARTARPALMARVELMRCAAQAASLEFGPCDRFERLRADAEPPERAYADYLRGQRLAREAVDQLPEAQRAAAAGSASVGSLQSVADPLSRLVAVAVLFQRGEASPEAIALAADTASAQGWRRPLLAWLGVQRQRALSAGAAAEAERLQRRIELLQSGGA